MGKKIREHTEERLAVPVGRLARGIMRGVGTLLGFAAELEQQGKSEYREQGEFEGETKSGKSVKGAYGFRMRVGLNSEEFIGRKVPNDRQRIE